MKTGAKPDAQGEVSTTVWAAVTIRVAWTLMMEGIRVRPQTLADARDHVLMSTTSTMDADVAEHRAVPLTREFLGRVRGEPVRRIDLKQTGQIEPHVAWRRQLSARLSPVEDALLRLHYGDGMTLQQVERTAAIDGHSLALAQESIRDRVRQMVAGEVGDACLWNDAKIDGLIARIANIAEPGCPNPLDILSDHNRAHADVCPRCSRAVRLIRGGMISPSDLDHKPVEKSQDEVVVGALILHPDARRVRRKLERALGAGAVRAGSDVWLMSKQELTQAGASLRALVDDGIVPRHHVRGAIVRGPGRWSGQVLLGPTAIEAIESARSRPWSEVDGLGELPPPRPAPPKATRWWASAMVLSVLAAWVGYKTLGPQDLTPDVPIEARFLQAEDGWEITFDLDDLAVLDIIAVGEKGPLIVHQSVRERRGQWATGGGNYRVYVPEESVALIATEAGIQGLSELIEGSRSHAMPLEFIQAEIRLTHPTVAWVASPAITTVEDADASIPNEP